MSASQARLIVAAVRNGLVGRTIENSSYSRPAAASSSSECSTQAMSGDVAVAISAGRNDSTSAP